MPESASPGAEPSLPGWDDESDVLRGNLVSLLGRIRDESSRRPSLSSATARSWHSAVMSGLEVPDPVYVGRFRGEAGLERCEVVIGRQPGAAAATVRAELDRFDERLAAALAHLDALVPAGRLPDADPLEAVVELMAWAHAEWVRIHPFANGNGRTARLWANAIALRYGLPPFVRLRPRPDGGYGAAGRHAMTGDWQSTAVHFRRMLARFVLERSDGEGA